MSNLRSSRVVLLPKVDPEITSWNYRVANLPQAEQTNAAGLVKCLSVVSSDSKQEIVLRFESVPSSRITRKEPLDKLLLVSLSDFRLRWPAKSPDDPPRLATGKENGDYATKLLTTGVTLNGVKYHFYGHSNSQLKSRSCFLYAASKEEISANIEAMGDLSKLKSVGKKAKRIGLLFSSAEMALALPPERCEDIEDAKRDDYIFTDGCGLISLQLARQLAQRRNILYRDKRYLPSVFQIRYRGYKGVLTLDPTLQGKVQIQFRESMRKFKDAADHSFSVVDYSKPYAFGSLNDEVIVLLHTLGISTDMLLQKQQQHLDFLSNVSRGDSRAAFQFLSYYDRIGLAEKLLLNGIESVRPTLRSLVRQEYAKMLNKRDEQRCRILIPKSRLLFGVCDPTSKNGYLGKLREGECFVRITHDGDGIARTVINTEVMVTRNPCLHPGDLQKFRAVNVPEWSHLVDCIVFSTQGNRPSADLMSGGDLDGDKFFVTWDPDIIPTTMAEPAQYPGGRELVTFGEVTGDSRAEYFARYTNASLGKVKNLYMKWARLGNAMSPQCQQLNRLFSQCVDGNNIRIPTNLKEFEDPPNPRPNVAPFILDVLHDASTAFIREAANLLPEDSEEIDFMETFLARDKFAISEFELLQLVLRWCERRGKDILEYSHLLDFSSLTDEQQIWLLGRFPPSKTLPSLVRNGLLQSELISPEELRIFDLDQSSLRWKPVFKSSTDRMGRFLPTVSQVLENFHKKLIVFAVDERTSFGIYVPNKIPRASEIQVDANVRVFAFPHSQGPNSPNYKVVPTSVNYTIFCDEYVFQLYQRERRYTWIKIGLPRESDSKYRNVKNIGEKRRIKEQTVQEGTNFECETSIALEKVSQGIKDHAGGVRGDGVVAAEIYVISNRDVSSMRVLDEWLNFVDTDEVMPLFENIHLDYNVPTLDSVDWTKHSEIVVAIVRDKNLSHLRHVDSVSELQTILNLLNDHDEKKMLRDTYAHILGLEASSSCSLDHKTVASTLLEYLLNAVYLIPRFLQSQTWKTHKAALEDTLIHLAPTLLQHLILLSKEMGSFIRHPFVLLLQELKRISLQDFANLIELIALTVRSADVALDLLLEILEPESSRLLVERPTAILQFTSSLSGIALDHIDEASNARGPEQELLGLCMDGQKDGYAVGKCLLRVDSALSGLLKVGDHVRFTAFNPPQNAPIAKPFSMDALVLSAESGEATFRCLHHPPSYVNQCAWSVVNCGSFVTSKTSFDAVTAFYTEREAGCKLYGMLLGLPDTKQMKYSVVELPVTPDSSLNKSQNDALVASMKKSLTFIWGPPGTGKTHTIVAIMTQLLKAMPKSRFLVTAPTHNAVDNLLRRFVRSPDAKASGIVPVRVSTQLSKVAPDLRDYTCDAMMGKDLSANLPARRKAQKRIKEARLIFSTCIGSALGLLRTENFDVVIIDEASQLTEPATLVPLVKSCSRAILVGDHVQLRATVQQNAALSGYEISLFERHYRLPAKEGVAKVMLDTQYRMHRSICDFSSSEFYDSKLYTAVADDTRPLPPLLFTWPENNRMVWIESSAPEDLGQQSKSNSGQSEACKRVIQLLTTSPSSTSDRTAGAKSSDTPPTIAILTPYTRQKTLLTSAIPNIEVSSIDGFQGREADIIIFVTVRCNAYGDLGFLTDMRRLNVVMTRARAGVIVIGNKNTLTGAGAAVYVDESRQVWKRLVSRCDVVELPVVENGQVAGPSSTP